MQVTWLPDRMGADVVLQDRSDSEAVTSAWQWPNQSLLIPALWDIIHPHPAYRNKGIKKNSKHVKFSLKAKISCPYCIFNQGKSIHSEEFSTQYFAFHGQDFQNAVTIIRLKLITPVCLVFTKIYWNQSVFIELCLTGFSGELLAILTLSYAHFCQQSNNMYFHLAFAGIVITLFY